MMDGWMAMVTMLEYMASYMDHMKYQEIWNENLAASAKKLPMDHSWTIQDNDPKHIV